MVEHIAWRMGCAVDLYFSNNDWKSLGRKVGETIRGFQPVRQKTAALGMIDDGSAEVLIDLDGRPGLRMESGALQQLDWFLALRCEQLRSGGPLVGFLEGLAIGLDASVLVRVCNVEDPHHAWEGVFRSIGIALSGIYSQRSENISPDAKPIQERQESNGDVIVAAKSANYAKIVRKTAESETTVEVDFTKSIANRFRYRVSKSIAVDRFSELLNSFSDAAGFTLDVDFNASVLSSSHVAIEDTALVLGRALKEILVLRMTQYGVNGAGSSILEPDDFFNQPVRVGVSVEGRKFWKLVPLNDSMENLRKNFIIGQTVCGQLFSEDLDDFLDGLAGGLGCGILVHFQEIVHPDEGWKMVFKNLGSALKMAFEHNPCRKGVPPGVKATLA
jgi:imidazoleglycerol phosphate dehydratase HisB